jgi:hypothetical protein
VKQHVMYFSDPHTMSPCYLEEGMAGKVCPAAEKAPS